MVASRSGGCSSPRTSYVDLDDPRDSQLQRLVEIELGNPHSGRAPGFEDTSGADCHSGHPGHLRQDSSDSLPYVPFEDVLHSGAARELQLRTPDGFAGGDVAAGLRANALASGLEDDGIEVIQLGRDGYTLVFVSNRLVTLLPLLAVSAGQFMFLVVVPWSDPDYFFDSGRWIEPVSEYSSLNACRAFSIILTLCRFSGEFDAIRKLFFVVTHRPHKPLSLSKRLARCAAMALQYVSALCVLLVALHLHLSAKTANESIWKCWIVYMTLDFDNVVCNFIVFLFELESKLDWKIRVRRSLSATKKKSAYTRLMFVGIPLGLAAAIILVSLFLNVCPLTGVKYGVVRNADPVLMLSSSLRLPGGCCTPQVSRSVDNFTTADTLAVGIANRDGTHRLPFVVSVPCLAPASMDANGAPIVYFVLVKEGAAAPSSLQVLEGRDGHGNLALRRGHARASPLQVRWWLTRYGFSPNVYHALLNRDEGGLALYTSNFPYVGEWLIPDYYGAVNARVYAVAYNPESLSLSPAPVESAMLIREHSDPNCVAFSEGSCQRCKPGFAMHNGWECHPCAANCDSCTVTGVGRCDAGGCARGYGLAYGACRPCASTNCQSCDASMNEHEPLLPELTCTSCDIGWGLHDNGSCSPCSTPGCVLCPGSAKCEACRDGFVLEQTQNGSAYQCSACADHCQRCDRLGAGECDPGHCKAGFSLTPAGQCAACATHCLACPSSGPGNCDVGRCSAGYGLQGGVRCTKCQVGDCKACDISTEMCEECSEGFGLTPEQTCEACARECKLCTRAGACAECHAGYALSENRCLACADQCEQCNMTGPGHCDAGRCAPGWTDGPLHGCVRCADPACGGQVYSSTTPSVMSQ
eukprot:TRINITY_DN11474_c1_g6_i1.p1 TRINITY_DN11474_c1_g6~~TRINITY_DN11474_c1_g6_i1.p1  ORF type:complete len:866 (-),score=66.14 TRINITY_DN11474_c1_g6_i1:39-2636(-)